MRVFAAVVLATVVAGCAATAAGHQRPAVGYPFGGAVWFSPAERAVFAAAEDVVVVECMRRRGFDYVPRTPSRATGGPSNPYGLLTPEEAHAHGYGIAEAALAASGADPNEQAREAMTESRRAAWDAALLGSEAQQQEIRVGDQVFWYRSDACTHLAREQIFGAGWDRLFLAVQAASNEVAREVRGSAGFAQAQQRWSDCMRGRGYQVSRLADARKTVTEALATAKTRTAALRLEQDTATADAACQDASGLWTAAADAQSTAERGHPAEPAARLHQARATALAAARLLAPPQT